MEDNEQESAAPSLIFGALPRTMSTRLVHAIAAMCPELKLLPVEKFVTNDSDPVNHIGLFAPELRDRAFDTDWGGFPVYREWVSQWNHGYAMKVAGNPWVFGDVVRRDISLDPMNFFVLRRPLADIGINLLERAVNDGKHSWLAIMTLLGPRDLPEIGRWLLESPACRMKQLFPDMARALVMADSRLELVVKSGVQEFRFDDLIWSIEDLRHWLRDAGYQPNDRDFTRESNFRAERRRKLRMRDSTRWKELARLVASEWWGF